MDKQKQLAVRIAQDVSMVERDALRIWISSLLELRASNLPKMLRAKQALTLTMKSRVVWPMLKIIGRQVKSLGWDNRSSAQKFGLGGAAVGLTFFSGSSAGIAALGGAIGVPLWIVFGAGSMFAGYLYEELSNISKKTKE